MNHKLNKTAELFSTGKNCAQSVVMVFAKELGISEDQAFAMAAGFGGGMAKNGEVCGAVTGAAMVLGLKYGQPGADPDNAKQITADKLDALMQKFKAQNGSLICKEIIDGVDLKTPEGQKKWADKNMHAYQCLPAVKSAVEILVDLV